MCAKYEGDTRRMVDNISRKLADLLVQRKLINRQEYDEYKYALLCNIESFISFGSIILLSFFFRLLIPTLCFLFSFITIRKRSGGYHFNSFLKCYISTIAIYISIVYIGFNSFSLIYFNFITAVASVIIIILGAVNHPNMNYSSEEYLAAKESARIVIILFDIIIIFMNYIKVPYSIILYTEIGVILCSILLLLSKIIKQEVKRNG